MMSPESQTRLVSTKLRLVAHKSMKSLCYFLNFSGLEFDGHRCVAIRTSGFQHVVDYHYDNTKLTWTVYRHTGTGKGPSVDDSPDQ